MFIAYNLSNTTKEVYPMKSKYLSFLLAAVLLLMALPVAMPTATFVSAQGDQQYESFGEAGNALVPDFMPVMSGGGYNI